MKKIYARAIEMADPVSLKEKLVDVVAKIDKSEHTERFLDILFDSDIKENELSHVVECYDEIRTRTSFDYLNDLVYYDYVRTNTRYFTNEDDATKYSKSGNYDYNNSKANPDDAYPYEAKYIKHSNSYCSVMEWINSKVVTE